MKATPAHLEAIDGLRGFAIALVIVYHAWLVYGLDLGLASRVGFLGVDLFFALSGFCMFYPYARARLEGGPMPTVRGFVLRRAAKIVPSYLIALTAFALLAAHRSGGDGIVQAYLAHLFFLHPLLPDQFQSISGPLWTIGIEVQFYAVFPLIAGFCTRRPLAGAGALAAAAIAYRFGLSLAHLDGQFYWANQLPAFLDIFAAGMLASYAVVWYRRRAPARGRPDHLPTACALGAGAAAFGACVLLAGSSAMTSDADFFAWQMRWRAALAVIAFFLVGGMTLAVPPLQRVVANPVTAFLALVSYNLYLWHLEILAIAQRHGVALVIAAGCAVLVAAAVTYGIERPLLALGRLPEMRAGDRIAA